MTIKHASLYCASLRVSKTQYYSYDFFNISCLKLHQMPGKQGGFSKSFGGGGGLGGRYAWGIPANVHVFLPLPITPGVLTFFQQLVARAYTTVSRTY